MADDNKEFQMPDDYISGIRCRVVNCKYNSEKQFCTAKEISIGPDFACSFSETICATFKPQ